MKFVQVSGGLGNQMFNYAFCLELRELGYNTILLVTRKKSSKGYGHQGFELDKVFNIRKSQDPYSYLISKFVSWFSQTIRFFPRRYKSFLFKCIGISVVKVDENFVFYKQVFSFENRNELFMGTWQSEKYFKHAIKQVQQSFVFKTNLLSKLTKEVEKTILKTNSVSIHIRRGDYFSSQYIDGFGGICTLEYYIKAISIIKAKTENIKLFIFTDDITWAKENLQFLELTFVSHNIGNNSWQDMYLMSICKHNIIANSSFSWWAAWLNKNNEKIVVAPQRWWSSMEKDDVVPENWIRI